MIRVHQNYFYTMQLTSQSLLNAIFSTPTNSPNLLSDACCLDYSNSISNSLFAFSFMHSTILIQLKDSVQLEVPCSAFTFY